MKFNPDAARAILKFIEKKFSYDDKESDCPVIHEVLSNRQLVADKYFWEFETAEVSYALELLIKEGYISLVETPKYANGNMLFAKINGLTMDGHEFLDNISNDTFWNAAKERAKSAGKVSLSALAVGAKTAATAFMANPDAMNNLAQGIHNTVNLLH